MKYRTKSNTVPFQNQVMFAYHEQPAKAKRFAEDFDKWFVEGTNYTKILPFLAKYCAKHFHKWSKTKVSYNIDTCNELARHCVKYFDYWWKDLDHANLWPWGDEKVMISLMIKCKRHFEKWWNPNKFYWIAQSKYLAKYCSDKFDIWWEPDKFNWHHCRHLAKFNQSNFDKWFIQSKFNYNYGALELAKSSTDKFDIWWDPNRYPWRKIVALERLIKFCHLYFDKWYDRDRILFEGWQVRLLNEYCNNHIDKWKPDMIIWRIDNDYHDNA